MIDGLILNWLATEMLAPYCSMRLFVMASPAFCQIDRANLKGTLTSAP